MKTLREMMDLVEAAQQPHQSNTKNPVDFPRTWHDVDPKLGKQVDKMSQAEKVKKGLAHPDTLKKKGVAEGLPQILRKVVPGYAKREIDKKMDAGKFGKTDADKDANFQRYKKIQDKLKEQGVAEEQVEESSPDAIAKIDELTRE